MESAGTSRRKPCKLGYCPGSIIIEVLNDGKAVLSVMNLHVHPLDGTKLPLSHAARSFIRDLLRQGYKREVILERLQRNFGRELRASEADLADIDAQGKNKHARW